MDPITQRPAKLAGEYAHAYGWLAARNARRGESDVAAYHARCAARWAALHLWLTSNGEMPVDYVRSLSYLPTTVVCTGNYEGLKVVSWFPPTPPSPVPQEALYA